MQQSRTLALSGIALTITLVVLAMISCQQRESDVLAPTDTLTAIPVVTRTVVEGGDQTPDATPGWRVLLPLVSREAGAATFGLVPTPEPSPTATLTSTPKPTKTPRPTATPTPPWPEPLSEPGPSKLGLHVQWTNNADIVEFVRRTKPRVVKGMDDLGFLAEVKRVSPSTITVGRFHDSEVPREGDPAEAARHFVAQHLDRWQQHPYVDYWEGVNEPVISGRAAWFAAFEAERVRLMAGHGLRAAIGAFSTGVPEWEDFVAFLPAVRAAKAYGGVLALHEYDAPTMQRSVGLGLPGRQGVSHRGVLALRYRWWYEELLIPQGLVVPLIISEAGVDGAVNPPEADGKGWRDYADYWAQHGQPDAVHTYVAQLAWYDAELRRDDYVIGCTIFTAGSMGNLWDSYDVTHILRDLAEYIVAQAR